jgi:hypothetical protein
MLAQCQEKNVVEVEKVATILNSKKRERLWEASRQGCNRGDRNSRITVLRRALNDVERNDAQKWSMSMKCFLTGFISEKH